MTAIQNFFFLKRSVPGFGQVSGKSRGPEVGPDNQKAALGGGVCAGVAEASWGLSWEMPGCGDSPAEITCEITADPMLFQELML